MKQLLTYIQIIAGMLMICEPSESVELGESIKLWALWELGIAGIIFICWLLKKIPTRYPKGIKVKF